MNPLTYYELSKHFNHSHSHAFHALHPHPFLSKHIFTVKESETYLGPCETSVMELFAKERTAKSNFLFSEKPSPSHV